MVNAYLSVEMVGLQVGRYLSLPLVTILQQLLFVVKQLLTSLCTVLKVRPLYDGVYGARLLTEPAVDTLGHVYVVACRTTATVGSLLGFYRYSQGGTDGLTELTRDAPLLPRGVAPQGVLATKPWAERTLLKGVVDGSRLLEQLTEYHPHAFEEF